THNINPLIDRITFGDTAQVQIYLGVGKIKMRAVKIEFYQAVIDGRQEVVLLLKAGLFSFAIIVKPPEGSKGDVERALAQAAVIKGFIDESCQFCRNH